MLWSLVDFVRDSRGLKAFNRDEGFNALTSPVGVQDRDRHSEFLLQSQRKEKANR